jgi:urease accessory protein
MRPDAARRPWVMTNLKTLDGVAEVVRFIETRGMLRQETPVSGTTTA